MKVFLSWSGEASKEAATALYNWLPTVIQTVKPYMSAENIRANAGASISPNSWKKRTSGSFV